MKFSVCIVVFMALMSMAKAQTLPPLQAPQTSADSAARLTFDMAPQWIKDHVQFPAEAFPSRIAFIAPVYIGVTWWGKVYLTQRPWYPDSAFEDEIVRVVGSMPLCLPVNSRNPADTRKAFSINFYKLLPPDSLKNFTDAKAYPSAPRFDTRKPYWVSGREAFLQWVYKKFKVPQQFAGSAVADTVTIDYTVDVSGKTTNASVKCKDGALQTALLDIIQKAPAWNVPAMINRQDHSVRMRDRLIIGINADGTKVPMRQYLGPAYENNMKLPERYSDLILTSVAQPAKAAQSALLGDLKGKLNTEFQSYKPADSSKYYTVGASFVVEKNGTVSDLTVLKAIDQKIEQQIIKAITSVKKWTPAQQGGEAVRSWMLLTWQCPTAYYTPQYRPIGSSDRDLKFRPDNFSDLYGGQYRIYRRGVSASDINLPSAGGGDRYYSNDYAQWGAVLNPLTGNYDIYRKIGSGPGGY